MWWLFWGVWYAAWGAFGGIWFVTWRALGEFCLLLGGLLGGIWNLEGLTDALLALRPPSQFIWRSHGHFLGAETSGAGFLEVSQALL